MTPYEAARKSVEALSATDQLRLVAELTTRLSHELNPEQPRSPMELEGLGREIWNDVNVDEYLRRERESWDG